MMPFRSCSGVCVEVAPGPGRRSDRLLEGRTGADGCAARALDLGRISRHPRAGRLIGALARKRHGDRANEPAGAGEEGLTPRERLATVAS